MEKRHEVSKKAGLVFFPGFCQGLARATISFPFDVIKTNAQVQNQSPWSTAKEIVSTRPSLLYRGFPFAALGVASERALAFGLFEKFLGGNRDRSPFLCAFAAAVPSSIISVPVLSITCNVVVGENREGSVVSYLRQRFREYGPRFFFRSFPFEVARSVVGGTLFMGTYGWCRKRVMPETKWGVCGSAIAAGWSVWMVQYPWDTIRTLYQIENAKDASVLNSARKHLKKNGFFSLFRGLSAVLIRTVPSAVGGMLVYEEIRKITH